MRVGLTLDRDPVETAREADRVGLHFVVVPSGEAGEGIAVAAAVAAATRDIRIVTTVRLGVEHPVTLAEEVAVVDQLSSGRVVALIDTAALTHDAADEDLALLRACWSGRWVRHSGARWTVPAGLHGDESPEWIAVTPAPAQLEMPVWLDGPHASSLAARRRVAHVVPQGVTVPVDPEAATLSRLRIIGDVETDREAVIALARAGVSHVFLTLGDSGAELERYVSRYLIPEAAMPGFPRIVADSEWPARWPV